VIVDAVVDDALSPDFPLGVELEVFVRCEDAERFIEGVRAGHQPAGIDTRFLTRSNRPCDDRRRL
jgi:hypothetical protein